MSRQQSATWRWWMGTLGAFLLTCLPAAAGECPDAMTSVAGHCCWPGQDWGATTHQCVGTPRCPDNLTPVGNDCAANCDPGMVSVAGHCCWPGQDWGVATSQCMGDPVCPEGLVARDGQCYPMVQTTQVPGFAGQVQADCNVRATELPGHPGERYLVFCLPECTSGSVWGTRTYTDDSAVCAAAVHAGTISALGGGAFVLTILPGRPSYQGSTDNNVTTSDWGNWSRSFTTAPAR